MRQRRNASEVTASNSNRKSGTCPIVQIEQKSDWSIALEAINTHNRLIASVCPVKPQGIASGDRYIAAVDIRISPPGSPLASQIFPESTQCWVKAVKFAFTEIASFDLHWPDNTYSAIACEKQRPRRSGTRWGATLA
ncbi:hypothetical protein THAOC_22647, partial [Thalassiosira oceanica]